MMRYTHIVADFEATTAAPVEVWLGCFTGSDTFDPVLSFSIEEFMMQIFRYRCANVYFHNLKYDGGFIMNYLLKRGYAHLTSKEYAAGRKKYFIGDYRAFTVYNGKNTYNFIDTFQLFPTSLKAMGDALSKETGMDLLKGDTPLYETKPDHVSDADIAYIKQDVRILMMTLKHDNDFLTYENGVLTRATKSNKALLGKLNLKEDREFKPLYKPKEVKLKEYEVLSGWDGVKPIITEDKVRKDRYFDHLQKYMLKHPRTFARQNHGKTFPFDIPDEIQGYMDEFSIKAEDRRRKYYLKMNTNSILRRGYKGGFTWVNPMHQGHEVGAGMVYDVNSMYPSIMRDKELPGDIRFVGLKSKGTIPDKFKGLYMVEVDVMAVIKDGCVPILKPRTNDEVNEDVGYYPDEIEYVNFMLTNMEYDYLMKCYDVLSIDVKRYYQFDVLSSIDFVSYIDDKMKVKESSTGMTRAMSKLDVNAPYGKFGYFDKTVTEKSFSLVDGVVTVEVVGHNSIGNKTTDIQIAVFITAYGRVYLGETINAAGVDRVTYCDTDSIHILGDVVPPIPIHHSRLGWWKLEDRFDRAKYLRAKTYAERIDGEWKFVIAGYNGTGLRYEDFRLGYRLPIKRIEQVEGGTLIRDKFMVIGGNLELT